MLSGMSTSTLLNRNFEFNAIDEKIIARHDKGVRTRARLEIQIVRETLRALMGAGYGLTVNNGEDVTPQPFKTEDEAVEMLFAVDEANLCTMSAAGRGSFVFFVFGNDGHDVICDYGVSLEETLKPVNELADRLSE